MFRQAVLRGHASPNPLLILSSTGWLAVAFLADRLFASVADSLASIDSPAFQLTLHAACTILILTPACLLAISILRCNAARGPGHRIFSGIFSGAFVGLCALMAQPYAKTAATYAHIAMDGDDYSSALIVRQGTEIRFEGLIGYGASRRVAKLLDEEPAISRIVLDSQGGRMGPAIALARIVKAHDLEVRVPSRCESACTLLFIASRHRILDPQAQLGFHSFHLPDGSRRENAAVNSFFAGQWRSLVAPGIDMKFLAAAYAKPADTLWRPDRATLKAAGL